MSCPIPNCPGRHPTPSDADRRFPAARLAESPVRDGGAPPIFREVLAAMANSRPYRPPAVVGAHLDNGRQPGFPDNGAGYLRQSGDPRGPWSNGGPEPGRSEDPWRRVLNR